MKQLLYRGANFLYKWLPVVFGCHGRPDRSFYCRGIKFPICARCTGVLFGMIAALVSMWWFRPPVWALFILMLPLVIDGLVQQKTRYESTNVRRLITGLLYGYALAGLIWAFLLSAYHTGIKIGLRLHNR